MATSTGVTIAIWIFALLAGLGRLVVQQKIFNIDDKLKKLTANKQAAATQTDTAAKASAPTPPAANAASPIANANSSETNTNSSGTNTSTPAESALDAYLAQWAKKSK